MHVSSDERDERNGHGDGHESHDGDKPMLPVVLKVIVILNPKLSHHIPSSTTDVLSILRSFVADEEG